MAVSHGMLTRGRSASFSRIAELHVHVHCLGILLLVISLCPIVSSQLEVLPPEYISPGGNISFVKNGDNNLYGNNVTLRSSDLQDSARKCWVDHETPLPAGVLVRFYIYIHGLSSTIDAQSLRLRLQIWRETDASLPSYLLVWQQRVQINFTSTGALYSFKMNTAVEVEAWDKIGFTNEGDYGPISFTYAERRRTDFSKVNVTSATGVLIPNYPLTGDVVKFEYTYLPSIFSIAVELHPKINRTADTTILPSASTTSTITSTPSKLDFDRTANTTILPSASTTSTITSTPSKPAFPISLEPLFGPVAGGTNITITGSSPNDHPPSNSGSYVPDVRDVINVYLGNDFSATSVFKVNASSSFELVAVTPNTTKASIGHHLLVIIEFSSTAVNTTRFNMTFNSAFTYLPNPNITSLYPTRFIVSGGTLLDVNGHSLSSVDKPIIQLTVVIYRTHENGSTLTISTKTTLRICTVPPGNDTYMQCPMPPLNLSDDFLAILNSGYNTSTKRRKRQIQPSVLTVGGPNGTDSADIRLGFILDGYTNYENINNVLQDIKLIFYSPPEINTSNDVLEFDPSEDELIHVKGRYMLRGCLLRDYLVQIGNQTCIISHLQDNQLSCRPPKVEPSKTTSDIIYCDQHLRIIITVGYKQYQYACLAYKDTNNVALIVGLIVGLVGFAILLTILIVYVVRCRRRKMDHSHQHSGGQELRHRHELPESHQDLHIEHITQNKMILYRPEADYDNALKFESNQDNDHHAEEHGVDIKANDDYLTPSDVDGY